MAQGIGYKDLKEIEDLNEVYDRAADMMLKDVLTASRMHPPGGASSAWATAGSPLVPGQAIKVDSVVVE